MRDREYANLKRLQQSVRYYSDLEGRDDPRLRARPRYHEHPYTHMLIDDISLAIIPFPSAARRNAKYQASIVPENPELEEVVSYALSDPRSRGRDLVGALYDFVTEAARMIAGYGEAICEIVYLLEPETDEPLAFDFSFIQPLTVYRRRGELVQYIPAGVVSELGIAQHVTLSPDCVLFFYLPKTVRREWAGIMDILVPMKLVPPDFSLPAFGTGAPRVPFDLDSHHHTRRLLIMKSVRDIGWNARQYPQDGFLEYYWLHRYLLFERFRIEIRESIIATLNEGLSRVGAKLGLTGQIQIDGLPTLEDVERAQEHLRNGDRSVEDIMAPFKLA